MNEDQGTVSRESIHTPCSHLEELPFFKVTGRRIVDMKVFFQEITTFKHLEIFNCKNEHLQIVNETRHGFKSLFSIKCEMCKEFKKVATDGNSSALDINKAIVLGAISTGGAYAQIQEQFGYCDIPLMSSHFFQKIQNELAETIHELAWEVIEQAGKQEKMIAKEKGHICKDSVPYITVVADGAWSKRSYKVNYDAASGVGVILGQETRKVLFLGIRNKYCCICTRAETKQEEPEQHTCFKNWDKPSTGMESDIIIEGFKKSVKMHGIKYLYLVGDGDSSVTKKLAEVNPYDTPVMKIECRNHLLRNYCTRLRDLAQKKISSKKIVVDIKQRNVLNNNIKRLRGGIVAAIKHVNEDNDAVSHGEKINLLKKDIYNGPYHVFGEHTKCSKYFCSGPKSQSEINWVPTMKESGLLQDILFIVERVARNAESLILNMDNNIAESYNAVLAKFVGGKRINFTARRSYTTRCEVAAISYNVPPAEFPRILHKKITKSSPGVYTKKIITARAKQAKWMKSKKNLFPHTFKRKQKQSTPADPDYGLPSLDLDEEEYERRKNDYLESIQKTEKELEELQINTIGQAESLLWKEERMKRLTASLFGQICKQRSSTHCSAIVKSILYNPFQGNFATNWGKEHENIAKSLYEELNNTHIKECGFFVDTEKPFLGASPDGLIGERGIVEVKCPQAAAHMTPKEAVEKKTINFVKILNGKLHLQRTHNYYFQVQGQLHVTKREYCVFIIWTPIGMESEIIFRDDSFWKGKMEKKLEEFYFKCLLPEIINPQHIQNRQIKDLRKVK